MHGKVVQVIIANVNVNGIRAAQRKGFGQWLARVQPDAVLLQEVRTPEEIARELVGPDYCTWINPSAIAGRAGVAVAVKNGMRVAEVRMGLATDTEKRAGVTKPAGTEAQVATEKLLEEKRSEDSAHVPSHQNVCTQEDESRGLTPPVRIVSDEVPVDTGRWLEVDLPDALGEGCGVTLISAYLHSGQASDGQKMAAKYAHLERVSKRLAELSQPATRPLEHVLVAGDFNIVHTQADITNWKGNHNKTAGVLDAEIAYLDQWFDGLGFVDVQRALTGDEHIAYTWWSNRGKAFDNNVGWRIDYQIADSDLAHLARSGRVDRAQSYAQRWSDHAPLVVSYEP